MKTFSSPQFKLRNDKETIKNNMTDLTKLKSLIEKAKTDKLQVKNATKEALTIVAPVLGEVTVHLKDVSDDCIRYSAENTPVPMNINLLMEDKMDEVYGTVQFETEIPPFLSGVVGGKLEPALKRIADAAQDLDFKKHL